LGDKYAAYGIGTYTAAPYSSVWTKSNSAVAAAPQNNSQQPAIPEDFVRIEGGTFIMGSPANEPGYRSLEGPQHQVTVSSFYMGKYEVTQKEYREVMGKNPSEFEGDNLPVENVSWNNAIEYCNKRSQKEGLTPAYTINRYGGVESWDKNANGYRLPTEAEWEYACRAGTTTAYNTGASINNNTGWYEANSAGSTHEVGQKPANAWGLYDMHGNVYELCWDWYDMYTSRAQDPLGPPTGRERVGRGGGWNGSAGNVRSAARNSYDPNDSRYRNMGFRVVRNAP
jgi:formylglycine-generating enzyme required for sulfatase activity